MLARYVTVLSFVWLSLNAQQYPQQYNQQYPQQYPRQYSSYYDETHNSINSKGVCTINGEAFYGIDCWCYSNKIGAVFITSFIVLLVIFFFLSGCIWACLIQCYRNCCARRDRDEVFDIGSLRSSMRR